MANSSVLEIVAQAFDELGLYPRPTLAVTGSDALTNQMTALYTAVGQMLVKRRTWRWLLRQHTITTPASGTIPVTYPLPSDYARPVNQTEWDKTNHWPLMGPMTPQQMQTMQSGIISNGPRIKFRLINDRIEMFPAPGQNQIFVLNYISKGWVVHDESGSGNPDAYEYLTKPVADDDWSVFDDRLMVAGIKMKFFQAKGFDATAYADDFQTLLDDALAQDSGAQKLTLAADPSTYLINTTNIPDGNVYGSP
jgi:hypothetical protein